MITPTTIIELSDSGFQQWRHNPITAAFLQFLGDQASEYEKAAMDLWARGLLTAPDPQPGMHPDMLRGRFLALTETKDIDLATIKHFYGIEDNQTEEGM